MHIKSCITLFNTFSVNLCFIHIYSTKSKKGKFCNLIFYEETNSIKSWKMTGLSAT